jgi:hypothetical protein
MRFAIAALLLLDTTLAAADTAPAPLASLAPQPLEGPFADLKAYCATQPTENRRGDKLSCNTGKVGVTGTTHLAKTGSFKEVTIFPAPNGCALGIATDAGWFVPSAWNVGCSSPTTIDELRVQDGMVIVRWHVRATASLGGTKKLVSEVEMEAVCGVGASRKVSCTPVIPVRLAEDLQGKPHYEGKLTIKVTSGGIDIAGDPAKLTSPATTDAWMTKAIGSDTGYHALRFP